MSITQKLLSVAALIILIGVSSCNDDESPSQLSKNDAKGRISEFNNTASGDLEGFADANGVKAIQDFFNLTKTDDPFGRLGADRSKFKRFFHEKGLEFRSIFVKDKVLGRTQSEQFIFDEHVGVYAWNPELGEAGEFEKVDDADIIIILFPTEGSQTNNAQLQLSAYSETEVYDEESEMTRYEPATLEAALLINDTEVASLDLTITWHEDGFPISGDVTLEVAPYKATVSFDDSGATTSVLSVSFLKNQEILVATSATAKYKDSSKSEASLQSIDGFVQFRELKIEGTVDVEASNKAEVDWNEVIDLALYHNGDKLGDIVFVAENDDVVVYLQYADGSKEKLEDVLQPVIDEIEALTEDLQDDN
jgi:hypothetical protein